MYVVQDIQFSILLGPGWLTQPGGKLNSSPAFLFASQKFPTHVF